MPEAARPRILVADDQADIVDALRLLLTDEGFDVVSARSPAEALDRLGEADFDAGVATRFLVSGCRVQGAGCRVESKDAEPAPRILNPAPRTRFCLTA